MVGSTSRMAPDPRQLGRAVNGFSLNNTLAALQEIATPTQYQDLLTTAGLGRFVHTPPVPTPEIAATEEEFARLFQQIYQMLGENIMRTMMRNWGTALGPIITGSDLVQVADQERAQNPPADLFRWAVEKSTMITDIFWAPVELSEDAGAYYVTMLRCPICLQIRGAREPVCTNATSIYAALLQHFTGRRVAIREIKCGAQGAEACVYAITKPAPKVEW